MVFSGPAATAAHDLAVSGTAIPSLESRTKNALVQLVAQKADLHDHLVVSLDLNRRPKIAAVTEDREQISLLELGFQPRERTEGASPIEPMFRVVTGVKEPSYASNCASM
jgi:hypothetical protein